MRSHCAAGKHVPRVIYGAIFYVMLNFQNILALKFIRWPLYNLCLKWIAIFKKSCHEFSPLAPDYKVVYLIRIQKFWKEKMGDACLAPYIYYSLRHFITFLNRNTEFIIYLFKENKNHAITMTSFRNMSNLVTICIFVVFWRVSILNCS